MYLGTLAFHDEDETNNTRESNLPALPIFPCNVELQENTVSVLGVQPGDGWRNSLATAPCDLNIYLNLPPPRESFTDKSLWSVP